VVLLVRDRTLILARVIEHMISKRGYERKTL
jgi:hypothetical protein